MELTDALGGHIKFTTYLSINKENPNDYDIVYLDECHSLLDNHEEFLSKFSGKILGLTGTPPTRRGTEKYRMVSKYCPIVYNFTVDEATDSNILNDYKIIVHKLNLSGLPTLKKVNKTTGGSWFTNEKKDYEYYTQRLVEAQTQKQKQFSAIMRMKAMMDYGTKESYALGLMKNVSEKCITFANTQKQAEELDKILWTFRQESYVPHALVNKDKDNNTQPVQIGWVDNEIEDAEAIINLSDGMPDTSNHLKKIHEIIENIDEKKDKARERWKKYKSIGFNIKAYKVS